MTVCVCVCHFSEVCHVEQIVCTPYEYEMCATVRGMPVAGWQRSFGVQASGVRSPVGIYIRCKCVVVMGVCMCFQIRRG